MIKIWVFAIQNGYRFWQKWPLEKGKVFEARADSKSNLSTPAQTCSGVTFLWCCSWMYTKRPEYLIQRVFCYHCKQPIRGNNKETTIDGHVSMSWHFIVPINTIELLCWVGCWPAWSAMDGFPGITRPAFCSSVACVLAPSHVGEMQNQRLK